jgi:hypothetical protein
VLFIKFLPFMEPIGLLFLLTSTLRIRLILDIVYCSIFVRPHPSEIGYVCCVRWYDNVTLGNGIAFIILFRQLMKETAKRISQNIADPTDSNLRTSKTFQAPPLFRNMLMR